MCRLRNIAMRDYQEKRTYQESVITRQTDRWTDGRTDRQTPDKVIPMCRYASQATQKMASFYYLLSVITKTIKVISHNFKVISLSPSRWYRLIQTWWHLDFQADIPWFQSKITCYNINIVVAFRGMHVSPAKHSYAWLPRKCDCRTDGRTDGRRTKWSLCAAMLRRRHKNDISDDADIIHLLLSLEGTNKWYHLILKWYHLNIQSDIT